MELEHQLRQASPKGRRLGRDENVPQHVRNLAASDSLVVLDDDFDDRFDKLRSAREILLLVVGDGIRGGTERLIQWINIAFGSSPCKFGLIELRLYDLPDLGRVVVPKTLLRTREVSRHVVSIDLQSAARDQVTVSVRGGPDALTTDTRPPHTDVVLSEEGLTNLIRGKNSPEIAEIAEQLRASLKSSGLTTKYCPSEILYGIEIEGDFISLVHVCSKVVYFLIPMRAARVLDEQLANCKFRLNEVAAFYRPSDLEDRGKNQTLSLRYDVLKGEIEDFTKAVTDIADTIRTAMTVA